MKKKLEFVDAQQMAIDHPDTFGAPDQTELNEIKEKDFVKVCAGRERFWCIVKNIDGNIITATVDNDLVFSDEHGIFYEDEIKFEKKNVYNVMT